METNTQRLLALVRMALWGQPVRIPDFQGMQSKDWSGVIAMASEQAISGIVASAILDLPKEILPPRELRMELFTLTLRIEQAVQAQQVALAQIQEIYQEAKAPFVLLKGLSIAQVYPKPQLRMPGDLDLYLYQEGDYERMNSWAKSQGYRLGEQTLYEQVIYMGKVVVENHLYISYFGIKKYDDLLRRYSQEMYQRKSWEKIRIGTVEVDTLPHTFNAVYIFHHILHHFAYMGIGLRQICDWFLFLKTYQEQIDRQEFVSIATAFDLLTPMRHFAQMGIKYLGVSAEILPFDLDADTTYADAIIQDCIQAGNFGFEHFRGKHFSGKWSRRFFMFRKTVARGLRIGGVSPEHIRSIPLIAIQTRLRLLWSKLFTSS